MAIIIGNWKMNSNLNLAKKLAEEIGEQSKKINIRSVICPPFTLINIVRKWLGETTTSVGGQNCYMKNNGAYTGEISAEMLADIGAEYVILGHSERRIMGETSSIVRNKAIAAINAKLTPIICVGENLKEKKACQTIKIIEQQIENSLPFEYYKDEIIVAYEPIWAIGTGRIAELDDINIVHSAIIATIINKTNISTDNIHILYGGSVKPDNAEDILKISDVGGLLVGGASLKSDDFCKILRIANNIQHSN